MGNKTEAKMACTTCAHCTEYANCGWSNTRPSYKIPAKELTHGACEHFCDPADFTADDLSDDCVIDIIAAVVEQARRDKDSKYLELIERSFANDTKRVVKSWL